MRFFALAMQRKRAAAVEAKADGNAPVREPDDPAKVARTVFIGNLPAATRPKRLRQLFAACGKVGPCRRSCVASRVASRVASLAGVHRPTPQNTSTLIFDTHRPHPCLL